MQNKSNSLPAVLTSLGLLGWCAIIIIMTGRGDVVPGWVGVAALIQAIATVVLVWVTWVNVRLTREASQSAASSAGAAKQSAKAAELGLQAAHMPLVEVRHLSDPKQEASRGWIRVHFANTGTGPAMWVRARLLGPYDELSGEQIAWSWWYPISPILHHAGSEMNHQTRATLGPNVMEHQERREPDGSSFWPAIVHHDEWVVEIEYESIVGTRYRTTFQARPVRWTRTAVDDPPYSGFGSDGVIEAINTDEPFVQHADGSFFPEGIMDSAVPDNDPYERAGSSDSDDGRS